MASERTKRVEEKITNQENKEQCQSYNNEECDEWKRLEKWRPGRRNFS